MVLASSLYNHADAGTRFLKVLRTGVRSRNVSDAMAVPKLESATPAVVMSYARWAFVPVTHILLFERAE